MNSERATRETEVIAHSIEHHRKNLFTILPITTDIDSKILLLLSSVVTTTVHEDILLSGMAMEIAIKFNFTAFQRLSYHLFDSKWLREKLSRRILVLTIQIMSRETAAIVANYNAVWIEHWNHFENESFSENLSRLMVT